MLCGIAEPDMGIVTIISSVIRSLALSKGILLAPLDTAVLFFSKIVVCSGFFVFDRTAMFLKEESTPLVEKLPDVAVPAMLNDLAPLIVSLFGDIKEGTFSASFVSPIGVM